MALCLLVGCASTISTEKAISPDTLKASSVGATISGKDAPQIPELPLPRTPTSYAKGPLPDLQHEELKTIAEEYFAVWSSFDQCVELIFQNREDLKPSDLLSLYSRYCVNTKAEEQVIVLPPDEHLARGWGRYYYKRPGLQEFAKKYFDIDLDTLEADFPNDPLPYDAEVGGYWTGPTPPVPINIGLVDYKIVGPQIRMTVCYHDILSDVHYHCDVYLSHCENRYLFDYLEVVKEFPKLEGTQPSDVSSRAT